MKLGKIFFKIVVYFTIVSIVLVVILRFVPPPITPLMIIRSIGNMGDAKKNKLKKHWKPLTAISTKMVAAVIASEDQNFLHHHGFDMDAIQKAYVNNNKGKRMKGGSTISQQVAKNLFLWPHRSYVRKAFEAYFTLLIELIWSKKRIMEVYLNIIELGPGIYGVESASTNFFNKPAKNLSALQAASLAAVLPKPLHWSPLSQTNYLLRRKNWISRQMNYTNKDASVLYKK